MSWNGSEKISAAQAPEKTVKTPPSTWRGVAALVAVVLAGGFAAWLVMRPAANDDSSGEAARPSLIAEVKPAVVTNATVVASEPKPIDMSKLSPAWRKYYDGRDTNKWKVVYNPATKKEYISRIVHTGSRNVPPPLYKSHSLNLLDAIAFKPIVGIMPNVHIDDRYMKSLQEGLIEKIEISPDDPDDIKERKQAMIELQEDFRKRLKNGEDLRTIVQDALDERNRVAAFKRALLNEQKKMRDNGASEDEIEEFVNLGNKKLEEAGATPIYSRRKALELIEEQRKNKMGEQEK